MPHEEDPEELVGRAQRGDRAAFDELFTAHRERIASYVRFRTGTAFREKVEVEDVVQETLVRAFESIGRFRPEGADSFFAWLSGIAGHVIMNLARRHRLERKAALDGALPSADSTVSPSHALARNERFDRLQRAVDGLSGDHRQVILLARVEGLPINEIARRMDRSPDAVTHLLLRALRKLRATFGETDSLHLPARALGKPDLEKPAFEEKGARDGER